MDLGETVDNKRLGHALQVAKLLQDKRDNLRSRLVPSVDGPHLTRSRNLGGKKPQRSLNEDDMLTTMIKLQASSESIFGKKV